MSCVGYDKPVLSGVMEGYAAEEAGLQEGDEIIRMNHFSVHFSREITAYGTFHSGETIKVTYARIKLKKGPANTTLIRPHTGFLPNARLSVESSSSPSIMQAPPNGNALMQYLVSPFCIPQIVGPRPKQNSFTRI